MRLKEFQSAIHEFVATREMRPRELVIVQVKDAEGFWCNVHEGIPIKRALRMAESLVADAQADTRVVKGPKREVVRVFCGPR